MAPLPSKPDPRRGRLPLSAAGKGPAARAADLRQSNAEQFGNKRLGGVARRSTDPASGRRVYQRGLSRDVTSAPNVTKSPYFGG